MNTKFFFHVFSFFLLHLTSCHHILVLKLCNQKRGVLSTHSTIEPLNAQPDPDLPRNIQISKLLDTWTVYWLPQLHATSHEQNRPLRTPSPALVRSHAQIPADNIHIILQIIYTPKAQAFFVGKFTKLQTFHSSSSLSLSPIFCSYDSTRTTRRSGESQAFSQDRPATDPSHSLCPSKFCLSILYRSIDLLTTILLISFNCLIFFF
jgi:hypothetical protein